VAARSRTASPSPSRTGPLRLSSPPTSTLTSKPRRRKVTHSGQLTPVDSGPASSTTERSRRRRSSPKSSPTYKFPRSGQARRGHARSRPTHGNAPFRRIRHRAGLGPRIDTTEGLLSSSPATRIEEPACACPHTSSRICPHAGSEMRLSCDNTAPVGRSRSHTPFAPTRFGTRSAVPCGLHSRPLAASSQPQHCPDRCGDPTTHIAWAECRASRTSRRAGHVGTAGGWHGEVTARGRGAQSEGSTAAMNSQSMPRAPFQPALLPSTAPSPRPRQASTPGLPRRSCQNHLRRTWIHVIRNGRAAERTKEWPVGQPIKPSRGERHRFSSRSCRMERPDA